MKYAGQIGRNTNESIIIKPEVVVIDIIEENNFSTTQNCQVDVTLFSQFVSRSQWYHKVMGMVMITQINIEALVFILKRNPVIMKSGYKNKAIIFDKDIKPDHLTRMFGLPSHLRFIFKRPCFDADFGIKTYLSGGAAK